MTAPHEHMKTYIERRPPLPAELLRLQCGITRRAVAEAMGLDIAALYRIEKGQAWPMPPTIVRLAAALDLPAEEMAVALLRGWLSQHGGKQLADHAGNGRCARKPEADVHKPKARAHFPEADAQKPEAGAQKPEAEAQKPEARAHSLEADARKPEADAHVDRRS